MYPCVYLCMYLCMYVCMYECMYVYMYVCMYVSMYVRMYVCMYICMYICMYVYIPPPPFFPIKYAVSGSVLPRHCRAEFMKQVLPRLLSPHIPGVDGSLPLS